MEFLAESIGLLDMVDEGGDNDAAAVESSTNVLSFLNFSSWTGGGDEIEGAHINNTEGGEGSESTISATATAEVPHLMKERAQSDVSSSEQKITTQLSDKGEEDDGEEELGASNLSLLSSLTPASPLTMSASSLNLLSSMNNLLSSSIIDVTKSTERRFSGLDRIDDLDVAYQDGLDNRTNIVSLPQKKNDIAQENASRRQPMKVKEQTTSIKVRARRNTLDHNILTKHVTQRIDARTNYDCFTGEVDALTGHIIHGKMVYRETGTVYEGPFITKYIPPQRRKSINTNINIIQSSSTSRQKCNEEREEDDKVVICDTISLRHGMNAICEWSDGMKFVGSWEYDHPICGKFTGLDWIYEGPLLMVEEEDHNDDHDDVTRLRNNMDQRYGGPGTFRSSSLEAIPSPPSSVAEGSDISNNVVRCIGIPYPLPGSVVFHGKGRFTRSDGLIYQGEFQRGLASGVGKETLSNGQEVYSGEFVDGLRHGVGTLMENYPVSDGRCDCDCQCQEGGQDKVSADRLDGTDTDTDSTTAARRGNRITANNTENGQSVDPGPDAAGGGTVSAPNPTANTDDGLSSHSTNNILLPKNTINATKQCGAGCNCQDKSTKTKRRYSSGVWCSGHFEIEDSRGTVHSNEFIEESSATVAAPTETSDDKNQSKLRASLTRTTWDMLDEKWLGI